jgi:hypothetical protein
MQLNSKSKFLVVQTPFPLARFGSLGHSASRVKEQIPSSQAF